MFPRSLPAKIARKLMLIEKAALCFPNGLMMVGSPRLAKETVTGDQFSEADRQNESSLSSWNLAHEREIEKGKNGGSICEPF